MKKLLLLVIVSVGLMSCGPTYTIKRLHDGVVFTQNTWNGPYQVGDTIEISSDYHLKGVVIRVNK